MKAISCVFGNRSHRCFNRWHRWHIDLVLQLLHCLKVLHIYGKTKALHHCGNYSTSCFAEVAAAVEAQLRFAAEEEAAAAASINEVFVLPEGGDLAGYGAEEDLLLAGYGEQDQALDSYATSYGRY